MLKNFFLIFVYLCLFSSVSFASSLDYYGCGIDPACYTSSQILVSDTVIQVNSMSIVNTFAVSGLSLNSFDSSMVYNVENIPYLIITGDDSYQVMFIALTDIVYDPSSSTFSATANWLLLDGVKGNPDNEYIYCSFGSYWSIYSAYQAAGFGPDTPYDFPISLGKYRDYDLSLETQSTLFFWIRRLTTCARK